MSPAWLFVGALNQPYHIEKQVVGEDIPLYLDGFAYAGHFNIQKIKQKWPQTVGHGFEEHLPFMAREKQAEAETA